MALERGAIIKTELTQGPIYPAATYLSFFGAARCGQEWSHNFFDFPPVNVRRTRTVM